MDGMNPIFLIDFYKVGHVSQYPEGVTQVWSNWTPRKSRVPGVGEVTFFGLQYFIKKYLQTEFYREFFRKSWAEVEDEYREVIKATLGVENPKTDHLKALYDLGYMPIDIYALPEGARSPIGVPQMVLTNTLPEFFWLPNYLESLLSSVLWKPSTSATTARVYREIFKKWAIVAGEKDFGFVDWQGHDFSFRGMSGVEDAEISGMGHLLSFSGTDTIPAILAARRYYGADLGCGGSVPATEHSVMCAGEKEGEFETFKRLITEVYPSGIVSIVSDTWDLWKVLTDYVPRLRDTILERDGKVVIRPDSGDPVKIICGDPDKPERSPANKGVVRLLEEVMGVAGVGCPMLNKVGAIYGDSITPERADKILQRIVEEQRLSPYNMVFGIGSYTYEYVTRDTFGFAMKATAVRKDGRVVPIFKKPVTDDGEKVSLCGIPTVFWDALDGRYYGTTTSDPGELDHCEYRKVFSNGRLLIDAKFDEIRERARA